jgi:hypothetical protein
VDLTNGFYSNDAIDSWLVRAAPDGSFSMASYKALTATVARRPMPVASPPLAHPNSLGLRALPQFQEQIPAERNAWLSSSRQQ